MRIGDRVRLLKGTEEGIIVAIKDNKIVEVEIEDGFVIPALRNEVVVVDKREATFFDIEEPEPERVEKRDLPKERVEDGIYLGIEDDESENTAAHVLNLTDTDLVFSIYLKERKNYTKIGHGTIDARSSTALPQFPHLQRDSTRVFAVSWMSLLNAVKVLPIHKTNEIILDPKKLKDIHFVNMLDKALALIRFDQEAQIEINADTLKERMMEGRPSIPHEKPTASSSSSVIDLHVDPKESNLGEQEILQHQLSMFEKAYDNALVMNLEKLKVIHGIGAGILRNEIHKRLSKKQEVRFFEDADKEKFGFGSTVIYF